MRNTAALQMASGSVYLSNNYRLAFNCDSVVPAHVAETKAKAYAKRTGKTVYVPGLGQVTGSDPEPDPGTDGDDKTKRSKK